MPEFAQFVALIGTDDAFRLPDDQNYDTRGFSFDLANLDPERTVLLMFKVAASGNANLRMSFAESGSSVDFSLNSPPGQLEPRSWHEIVPKNILRASGNRLLVVGTPLENGAFMSVSDIVILYHATTAD